MLSSLVRAVKFEHPEFNFDDPKAMINHCSYFGVIVMQKLAEKGIES